MSAVPAVFEHRNVNLLFDELRDLLGQSADEIFDCLNTTNKADLQELYVHLSVIKLFIEGHSTLEGTEQIFQP
jgi:hypothetical protein